MWLRMLYWSKKSRLRENEMAILKQTEKAIIAAMNRNNLPRTYGFAEFGKKFRQTSQSEGSAMV